MKRVKMKCKNTRREMSRAKREDKKGAGRAETRKKRGIKK
jgi:hypothetical protein